MKRIFISIFAIIFILIFPVMIVMLIKIPELSNYVKENLDLTNSDFINYSVNYISLVVSVILGIAVYFQSQRINELEVTQYNTFLGVEDVDYTFTFGNFLVTQKNQEGFCVSHIFTSEKKGLLTSVNIDSETEGKSLVIPLVFITKNQPLIVSISFESVDVKLKFRDEIVVDESFRNNAGAIYTILEDGSRFVLCFGILMPITYEVDEVWLRFRVAIEDQNGNRQKFTPTVTLNKRGLGTEFYLSSSHSECTVRN